MLLADESALRQLAVAKQLHHTHHAGGGGQLDGGALGAAKRLAENARHPSLLLEAPAAPAAGRCEDDHDVLAAVRYGLLQHLAQQIAVLDQAQVVQQKPHGVAVAGVANGLVIEVADFAGERLGKGAQPARRVEGFELLGIERERLVAFERLQRCCQLVHDRFARVAVFVDDAVDAPGEVVAQAVGGMAREGAHAKAQVVQLVEAAGHVSAQHADHARREAALGHQRGAGVCRDGPNRLRRRDVLGQVEIMSPASRRSGGDLGRAVERQRIDHDAVLLHSGSQRGLVIDVENGAMNQRVWLRRCRGQPVRQRHVKLVILGQHVGDGAAHFACAQDQHLVLRWSVHVGLFHVAPLSLELRRGGRRNIESHSSMKCLLDCKTSCMALHFVKHP